jgi:DNA polymerase-3 subunit gamma/tau
MYMGKALYREYRPKSLETVVGQKHITETLKNAIKKNAISHAYLFTGPRGVGKTSVARILAHEINNLDYNEDITQLDIIEIDAASNRRIDEIRDLRDKVHIAPTSCKYKVYIIDEVHMLTREAFNALLKTLEEPPGHAVFILATTESHKVPETIISRTQRFSFKPINNDAISKQLKFIAEKESIKITEDALDLLAEHGNGSFRDSISMLDQIAGFDTKEITSENIGTLLGVPDDTLLSDILAVLDKNDVELLFKTIQKLRENGANPAKTAQLLIKKLRSFLIENKNVVDSSVVVKLMKELLPLTGVQSSFEAIEIALLDCITFDVSKKNEFDVTNTINKKTNINTETINSNIDTEIKSDIHIEIPEVNIDQAVEEKDKNDNSKGSWNDVLTALKVNHNTLYGVLRMADTKVEKEKITLTFQFEFHKKQLNQANNIATLKSIITDKLGRGYSIESEVIKKQKVVNNPPINNSNETLSSVSNIFGGAELLES